MNPIDIYKNIKKRNKESISEDIIYEDIRNKIEIKLILLKATILFAIIDLFIKKKTNIVIIVILYNLLMLT